MPTTVSSELQKYLLQSNVINLSIGIVFGSTFGAFISSIVNNLIYPLLSYIFYNVDFTNMNFKLGKNTIDYGNVTKAGLTFVISMLTVFFLFIKPFSKIVENESTDEKNKTIKN
jgi:large conductance mechanosensitive channel